MLIEQRRTIGTANHKFTHRETVAYTEAVRDGYWPEVTTAVVLRSARTHEELAEITASGRVYGRYDGNREDFEGSAEHFSAALTLALGRPASGAWYAARDKPRTWSPRWWQAA
jgi:hypothetical protein